MSTVLRSFTKHARSISRANAVAGPSTSTAPQRAFHSPFVVLEQSAQCEPAPTTTTASAIAYEKQSHEASEPYAPSSGHNTYVVSHTPEDSFYNVPAGAFPTSSPYVNYPPTEAPEMPTPSQLSSTSSDIWAHPTTQSLPRTDKQ
ncbi:hypothetical protein FISHEDRAFT_56470 [Fistulina hepatica ATCC 64428]|uniref:Uncharacterized protein n=1 Tax=Fistulina hepatica ATCC 64428 TaxID=1128425 RepID=A0A0D7AJ74_9AGAR|nr:hypothetical protein FISHEDRAFT_56470 [Fistulina hepatica ATCC 64428]